MIRAAQLVPIVLALGCPRTPEPTPPDDPATTDADAVPVAPTCGDATTLIVDPAVTLPHHATVAALLELGDPALDGALVRLSEHARGEQTAIPVRSAFSIAQWSWEAPLVRATFERLGFVAGELAAVHTDDAPPLWILPLGCELARAIETLSRDAQLTVKDLGDAVIATPRAGSAFAFDVVLRKDAALLVAAGRGRDALAAWRERASVDGGAIVVPGVVLAEIERAPIRMLVRPSGLVAPDATSTHAAERRYRVTADRVLALDEPGAGAGS